MKRCSLPGCIRPLPGSCGALRPSFPERLSGRLRWPLSTGSCPCRCAPGTLRKRPLAGAAPSSSTPVALGAAAPRSGGMRRRKVLPVVPSPTWAVVRPRNAGVWGFPFRGKGPAFSSGCTWPKLGSRLQNSLCPRLVLTEEIPCRSQAISGNCSSVIVTDSRFL